jgi:hypothetical protein
VGKGLSIVLRRAISCRIVIMVSLAILTPCPGTASECLHYENHMVWRSYAWAGLDVADLVISDQIACLVGYESPLSVVDVANPTAPTVVGDVTLNAHGFAIARYGDYAYVICQQEYPDTEYTLEVVDVGTPTEPMSLGFIVLPGEARDLAISGDHAYVASDGLHVIDIANPAAPQIVGTVDLPSSGSIAVQGNYALITSLPARAGVLHVIDISEPTLP